MLRVSSLAVVASLWAAAALADPAASAPEQPPTAAAWEDAAFGAGVLDGGRINDAEMSEISGGQEARVEVATVQSLTGSSTGNSVTGQSYVSGDVTFSTEALSGFSGIGNFVINTGANNTLQGSINVSIVTVPAP